MMVHFRKRFAADVLAQVNNAVAQKVREKQNPFKGPDEPPPSGIDSHNGDSASEAPANNGKLLVDATCAPADITYPTDIKLLNKAREKSEKIIDILDKVRGRGHKKPRTYRQRASRQRARKQFLSVAKAKRVSGKTIRQCRRQQLGYLRRNLKSIDKLAAHTGLLALDRRQYKALLVISEVLR